MTRKTWVCAIVALFVGSQGAHSDDRAVTSTFGEKIRVPANIGFSTNISPDSQALTLLFDNLLIEVEPTKEGQRGAIGQTAISSKVFTVEIPYSTDLRSVNMNLDLRGTSAVTAGGRVRLVAHAGETTEVVPLSGDSSEPVKQLGSAKAQYLATATEVDEGGFEDFNQRIVLTVPTHAAKPVCQVTLFLLAEHDSDNAGSGSAVLIVDSLDLSFAESGEGAYRR